MRTQLLSCLLIGLLLPTIALAKQAEQVRIEEPVLRVLPGTAPAGGYFTIINDGLDSVILTGVDSPAFDRGDMHESTIQAGQNVMEKHPTVSIAAGEQMAFQPGGYHLMLMGRQQELAVGDDVTVVLKFDDDSTLNVSFEVVPPTYQ